MTSATLVAVALAPVFLASPAGAEPLALGNDWVQRSFAAEPYWRTTALACPADHWALETDSAELAVELLAGPTIQGADWRLLGAPTRSDRGDLRSLTVRLGTDRAPGLEARVTYRLRTDQAWMRKDVVLTGPSGLVVSRVDLEPMTVKPAPRDHSGQGMPILVGGRCWFGVEYPASRNRIEKGRLELSHFPGRELGDEELACKTAVCGMARPGQALGLAFEDYLTTVTLPPRHFLHYNSWYDLRGGELSPAKLVEVYDGFRKGLLQPYDIKLDAMVIDDGWQERESIWRPRADLYPEGFGPLARALEAGGTRLGLWMPLSGFNLDTNWGARRGYEKSSGDKWYCLGGPRFYAAMRNATARLIREGNLNYYKHDFNFLSCDAQGHQHLPAGPHGHEVNVDRTLELLDYQRQLQPEIFLNVTSGMWYSPWWLMDADSIWGAFPGDTGFERSWPQLTRREWAISFRDVHLHRMYRQQPNNLFPISRLMTHGITQGRYNMLGGDNEPLREWVDYVMMYFGRGVLLQELYLSPERMREDQWQAVGRTIKWAHEREKILARTQMIGGDPARGEAYGFAHWLGDEGVWLLRNPDLEPRVITVPVGQTSGYRGHAEFLHGAVTYPYLSPLPEPIHPGEYWELELPPASVVVVEVRPQPWGAAGQPPAVQARGRGDVEQTADRIRVSLRARIGAEETRNARLCVVLRGGATGGARVDCAAAEARRDGSGPGWEIVALDLKPPAGEVQATVDIPTASHKPFAARRGKVQAWLVYEAPAPQANIEHPPAHLPWAVADGWRRQSVKLLDYDLNSQARTEEIAPDQFQQITAARLHLDVFGVNAAEYANKWVLLNGDKLCRVPFNDQGNLDRWEEKVLELTPEQTKKLSPDNVVVLTNETGDCYKVRNLALAVQLPGGAAQPDESWVESTWDEGVYCSVSGWLHAEGKVFPQGRSPDIHLRLKLRGQ